MENVKIRYENGESLSKIASSLGLSFYQLRNKMEKLSIDVKVRNEKVIISEEQLEKFLNYYSSGFSLKEASVKIGSTRRVVSRFLKEKEIDITKLSRYGKQNLFSIEKDIFETIDTEEKAYWLGFLLADGYVSKDYKNEISLCLAAIDYDHVVKFAKFIGRDEKSVKYRKKTNSYRFSFNDKKIKLDLEKHGVYNNKSLTCNLNEKIMNDESLKWHYLRGLFDGDGCISTYGANNDRFLYIMNGSYEVIEQLSNCFYKEIGINKEPKPTLSKCFEIRYYGKNSDVLLEKMYLNSSVFLERKMKKYIAVLERRLSKSTE